MYLKKSIIKELTIIKIKVIKMKKEILNEERFCLA